MIILLIVWNLIMIKVIIKIVRLNVLYVMLVMLKLIKMIKFNVIRFLIVLHNVKNLRL